MPEETGSGSGQDGHMTETGPPTAADTSILGRYGLVRPREDRQVAGVCAAIARVTGTDPVLWRVLMAVGVLFGGVGLLGYVLGWLLMPEDGDTGSPLEALFGHGRSGTSPAVTVLLSTAGVILLAVTVQWTPVAAAVIAGVGYLVYRQRRPSSPAQPPPGQPLRPPAWAGPGRPDGPEGSDEETELLDLAERYRTATYPLAPDVPVWPQPGPPDDGPGPEPAAPPRQPSALGKVTVFGILFVLGVVALVDLAGAALGTSAYLVTALAVTGAALLTGAWFGRARRLIWVGLALSVALAVATTAENLDPRGTGAQQWQPSSVAQIEPRYRVNLGYGNLDLRDVDFTGQDVTIRLTVNTGSLEVYLPRDVDLDADVRMELGNVGLLGQNISGASVRREVFDLGADQESGPGRVTLRIAVNRGNLEVYR
jgi:phage shock protein PspC (stress-responsive transcriptional regulator)